MRHHPNIDLIERAVAALEELAEDFVFIGGTTTTLLITDLASPSTRASIDVDAIVEISGLPELYSLRQDLRAKGFYEDADESALICRWRRKDLILDIMPTDEDILGFGNRWYKHAVMTAEELSLPSGRMIRHVNAPCFLATKLEAFYGRGNGDYLASEDMEDIVALLDGRPEIVDEISASDSQLQRYLIEQLEQLLRVDAFRQALPGHLEAMGTSGSRTGQVLARIGAILAIA